MAGFGKNFSNWISKLGDFIWPRMTTARKEDAQSSLSTSEKALVIITAYSIAIGSWIMVNLDNDFNLNLQLQLTTGEIDDNLALASPIPSSVDVNINGKGWMLLNLYNSPPSIPVKLDNQNIDLESHVQSIISAYPNINITKVQPSILEVQIEPKINKKLPIQLRSEVTFSRQFNFICSPVIRPDSVVVTGAQSIINALERWPTVVYTQENVRESISAMLELETPPSVLELSSNITRLSARVSEYTEGELRLQLRIRGLPPGREVVFNPSTITVRYDVPIEEYQGTQDVPQFAAFVDYTDLVNDTTGLVTPIVEYIVRAPDIRLKSTQPRTISYYIVLTN